MSKFIKKIKKNEDLEKSKKIKQITFNKNVKKKKMGLYKTFDIYNEQLNYLITKYKKLKKSVRNWSLINKEIKEKIIYYDNKLLFGNIKYKFKGKIRIDDFSFFFNKKKEDKEFFNIFRLNNLILKEAFSKLNRHGKAFKYIYDMIYRKIMKYPYLITIKPKTIIIFEYESFTQHIIEWKYNKKINKDLSLKNIKKWLSIKLTERFNIFKNLNLFNYCIYYNYLTGLNKGKLSLFLDKTYRSLILIKNTFTNLEYNHIIKMKRRIIDLNECLNIISYEYIEEECEDIYLLYIKNIKEEISYFSFKEKLFNLKRKIKILKNKKILKDKKILKVSLDKVTELIKILIKNKNYTLDNLQKIINPKKLIRDTFFFKEKLMEKRLDWLKNIDLNSSNSTSNIKCLIAFKYNFLYKLYFLYFFWSMFYLNKIFSNLNKIFFNLWNRFYYFFKTSSKLDNNILFYTYLILYKDIYLNIEFENKWSSFFSFIKKNMKYNKHTLFLTNKVWDIYSQVFIINKALKNYIFNLYNKHLSNIKIYKFLYKNTWKYEQINRINNIIDNNWKDEYNYKIYYNYDYFSNWKIPSIHRIDFIDKPINKLYIEYKKMNNNLIELFSKNKGLMKDYLIDPEINDDIYIFNKLNKNKNKLWYK
jgi:hypothetical protein